MMRRYRWRLVSECPPGTPRPRRKLQYLFDPIAGFELDAVLVDSHLELESVELVERATSSLIRLLWDEVPGLQAIAAYMPGERLEPGQRLSVVCRTDAEPGTCTLEGRGLVPPSTRAGAVLERAPNGDWLEVVGFRPRDVLLDELARLDPLDRLRSAAQAFYATDVAEPSPELLEQRERELDAALRAWIQGGGAS